MEAANNELSPSPHCSAWQLVTAIQSVRQTPHADSASTCKAWGHVPSTSLTSWGNAELEFQCNTLIHGAFRCDIHYRRAPGIVAPEGLWSEECASLPTTPLRSPSAIRPSAIAIAPSMSPLLYKKRPCRAAALVCRLAVGELCPPASMMPSCSSRLMNFDFHSPVGSS